MCAGCVMAATAGASGVRAWLQAQHLTWLTPRLMRAVTIALLLAAVAISSVGLQGSTAAPPRHAAHATASPAPAPPSAPSSASSAGVRS
jgi:hypothetical protein